MRKFLLIAAAVLAFPSAALASEAAPTELVNPYEYEGTVTDEMIEAWEAAMAGEYTDETVADEGVPTQEGAEPETEDPLASVDDGAALTEEITEEVTEETIEEMPETLPEPEEERGMVRIECGLDGGWDGGDIVVTVEDEHYRKYVLYCDAENGYAVDGRLPAGHYLIADVSASNDVFGRYHLGSDEPEFEVSANRPVTVSIRQMDESELAPTIPSETAAEETVEEGRSVLGVVISAVAVTAIIVVVTLLVMAARKIAERNQY